MTTRRAHFESRAAELTDCATTETVERDGAVWLRMKPDRPRAAGVVLYLGLGEVGTVAMDDPASVPFELGEDLAMDFEAIDHVIAVAVEGRATAVHVGRGGCVETTSDVGVSRTWLHAFPWPGWRRRARRVEYEPYR